MMSESIPAGALPQQGEDLLNLAIHLIAAHQAAGAKSQLKTQQVAELYFKVQAANSKQEEAIKLHCESLRLQQRAEAMLQQAETILQQRDAILGVTSEEPAPGSLKHYLALMQKQFSSF